MSPSIRVAVNMQLQRDENGHVIFRAALPMGVWFEKSLDKHELETARGELEQNYRALVETLRELLPRQHSGDVMRYWRLGDAITEFENGTANALVFVDKLSEHLARDVEYSRTMLDLARRFRQNFPDAAQVDQKISFDAYHRSGFDLERARAYERAKPPKRPRGRPRKK